MKLNKIMSGLLTAALSGLAANACILQVRIACPNDRPASGVKVCVDGVGCAITDEFGIVTIDLNGFGTFNICVDTDTLPQGATLKFPCHKLRVDSVEFPELVFELGGDFCSTPPPPGGCWLTGGGTVGKTQGTPNYSFGGVVYPGCSPKAADGGNWNVIDHFTGLHFQGQHIIVDSCSGVSTESPRVDVNIIDFHGEGIIGGIGGNPEDTVPVTFVGRAIDNLEPGGGIDRLYISVSDGSTIVLQIGNSAADPAVTSTGNLQIHTTSCSN